MAIFMGVALFLGLLIAKLISKDTVTIKTFIPPLVGGIVAGMVVYFFGTWLLKRKK